MALEKQYQKEEQAQKENQEKQNKYTGKGRGAFLSNFRTAKERQEAVDRNLDKILKKSPGKTKEEAFELLQAADSMDTDISELAYGDYNLEDLTFKTKEARNISDVANKKNKVQEELEQVIETLLEHKKFDDANVVIDRIRAL